MAIAGKIKCNLQVIRNVLKECRSMATTASQAQPLEEISSKNESESKSYDSSSSITTSDMSSFAPSNYRFIYPEFLPDPHPNWRNYIREKLERKDMLARRANIYIPEFYVGSILAVTYSDIHAPGKKNRFLGICIKREGCGLRAAFILRNVIDNLGVEMRFDLYDPTIQQIECIRLEKRLDDELFYLRDAPPEYSTFPLDMEPEFLPEGSPVPINDIVVPLKPLPWLVKWELMNMKGLQDPTPMVNRHRQQKAKKAEKPWLQYDLMLMYRETIPEEEQREIFAEVHGSLQKLEMQRKKLKRGKIFIKPKKTA